MNVDFIVVPEFLDYRFGADTAHLQTAAATVVSCGKEQKIVRATNGHADGQAI
jgi:hypothetical protein